MTLNTLIRNIIAALSLALPFIAEASARTDTEMLQLQLDSIGSGRQDVFRGKYHTVTPEGDSVLVLVFNNITVFPPLKFKNKKEEEFYWRTVRDVKRTLPYAKLICETLTETYEYIETLPTKKEREQHLKQM